MGDRHGAGDGWRRKSSLPCPACLIIMMMIMGMMVDIMDRDHRDGMMDLMNSMVHLLGLKVRVREALMMGNSR